MYSMPSVTLIAVLASVFQAQALHAEFQSELSPAEMARQMVAQALQDDKSQTMANSRAEQARHTINLALKDQALDVIKDRGTSQTQSTVSAKPAKKHEAKREVGRRTRMEPGSHESKALHVYPEWRPCGMARESQESKVCGKSNRFPPELVSHNSTDVELYRNVICKESDGWEEPQHPFTVSVTSITGGETCAFSPSSTVGPLGMFREAWNSTHTMLLGDWEGQNFLSGPQRRTTMANKRSKMNIDADLMMSPYAHFHSIYAHAMLDFLPQAYATFELVRRKNLQLVVGSNLQKRLLLAAGLEHKHININEAKEDQALCVNDGRSIWFVETNIQGTNKYYYHRMLSYRGIGASLAVSMVQADFNGNLRGADSSPAVVYLGRCNSRARGMDNEDAAFELVKTMMERKGRKEQLVRFCGEASKPEVQAATMRRARTVIGPHGGAMANLLYVNPGCDTKIVEYVQPTPFIPPGINPNPQNRYKSFFYYGMGRTFDYKVVLMDKSEASGLLSVRLDDLKLALDQIW